MEIKHILHDKKSFLKLLLLADEQEDMIDKYLERGDLFALYDDDLKSVCVVTQESTNTYELKNLVQCLNTKSAVMGKPLFIILARFTKGKAIMSC